MFHLFSPKDKTILGIDIHATSIQLVQLSYDVMHTTVHYCLEHYASERLPSHTVDGGQFQHKDGVADCLQKLLVGLPKSYERVVLAVPDGATISKTLSFHEGLSDLCLEGLVRMEAEKYMPDAIETLYVDFKVLGSSLEQEGMTDVLMVAARSDRVGARVGLMKQVGLDVDIMDVESYALVRTMPWVIPEWVFGSMERHIVVFNMEVTRLHIFVLRDTQLVFSHEEPLEKTQGMDAYQITRIDAHELTEGVFLNDSCNHTLDAYKLFIIEQLTRALQYFFTNHGQVRIDYLVLMGSMARLPDMESLFEQRLSIPTCVANPFAKMKRATHIDYAHLSQHSPMFVMACGLALRCEPL